MNWNWNDFFSSDYSLAPMNVPGVILGLVLAFVGGQTIAWIYMYTHSGLSYSRSFVGSLLVIPVVVALVMMVLSNNLVTAFGLMAVFAIVRFRNVLRDTLDTSYVLAVIVIGMACGTMKFATAVLGCAVLSAIMLFLWFSSLGTRHRYDVIINLHWSRPSAELGDLRALFHRHSMTALCASQRSQEGRDGLDLSYRLLLRDPERLEELLNELQELEGVSRISGLRSEEQSEV